MGFLKMKKPFLFPGKYKNMESIVDKLNKVSFSDFKEYVKTTDKSDLKKLRNYLDDLYYNSDKSIISDSKYDYLKDALAKLDPVEKAKIGAPLREGENRVELPYWLGSMDKIYPEDTTDYNKWIIENRAAKYVVSEKLDGVSCLLIWKGTGSIELYTRGDGVFGADISYLRSYIQGIPTLPKKEKLAIRGELIIPKKEFEEKYAKKYKNARNLVSGVVNSKTLKEAAESVQFVAYEIISDMGDPISEQFDRLKELGFQVAEYVIVNDISIPTLQSILVEWKKNSDYDIDGIIIQKDTEYYRNTSGNPNYAFAFKMVMDDAIVQTKVIQVEWNVSKRGQLKPRVKIQPVNVSGVTINYVTAFNAKYIDDNKIGPGAVIKVTRSGEVIPYIVEVVKGVSAPQMPDEPYEWNETHVDIISTNDSNDLCIKLIVYFFQTFGIKFVSEATVKKLYDAGFDNLIKIISAKKGAFSGIEGLGERSGNRIIENISEALKKVSIFKLMSGSGIFGFGIGEKKIKRLLTAIPTLFKLYYEVGPENLKKRINKVEGFSDKTTDKIVENIPYFIMFYRKIKPYIMVKKKEKITTNRFKDMKIVFTGFRDEKLKETIELEGGQVMTSVSKNTNIVVASNPAETTGKVQKAKELKIPIFSKKDFIEKYMEKPAEKKVEEEVEETGEKELKIIENFITQDEEKKLVDIIDSKPWNEALARRTQHYNYEYDYKKRGVSQVSDKIPEFNFLIKKLQNLGYYKGKNPENIQIIVNEYTRDQGISPHADNPEFGDIVISLSLLYPALLIMTRDDIKRKYILQPRSLFILEDEFRDKWKHEISKNKTIDGYTKPVDYRRLSITFRTIKQEDNEEKKVKPAIKSPEKSIKSPVKTTKDSSNVILVIGKTDTSLPLAIFDFDHTLVKPKDARPFPTNKDDWMWLRPSVPDVVRDYSKSGYQVVIVTDQSKDWKIDMIKEVVKRLDIPVIVIIGMKKESKKPSPELFLETIPQYNKIESFYVGDAAGRPGDWADTDKLFAQNIGIVFKVPEEVFPASLIKKLNAVYERPEREVVVMVGLPASGKSHFAREYLSSYEIISGDLLKTPQKMIDAAEKVKDKSVVFDATNVTVEKRKIFIDYAKRKKLPVRCIWIDTKIEDIFERTKQRNFEGKAQVPAVAIYTARKRFETPTDQEGCEVVRVQN